ncbi:aromatic ring-hydroxylating dioxygenase subunit alpha [Ruegeria sp. Ofav3-42]|uniref:aromatic ring-hydroxylating oxygenase subunit alpha n=1 Tax=Ruegeria sp. Ofav3-42 TaxID=2917759 RepID=UPI001EF6E60F|nr:aromatic ring-hydroxylating dioxygenase subunit alpha [Ruegeria sp. Ofav3-42]MCG7518480.1 aromatic ring-hydroxylating dioxygenase subunit alpha [Ruegeria sp. Ofav3-42]
MGEMSFSGGVYQSLPSQSYCDDTVFSQERTRIFRRSWHLIGHSTDIANFGDYVVEEIDGISVIVIRGQDGEIRAFYNVCVHRGHELLQGSGCTKKMTCPYHAWTYDTTGQLRAAPNAASFPGFEKEKYKLRSVRVELFFGLILVNLDDAAQPLASLAESALPEISEYAPNLPHYRRADRTDRLAQANWKVVAENFNECYHCAVVHKTLTAGVVDPDQYRTRGFDYGIRHASPARPDSQKSYSYVADPEARTDKFLTWWFFPLFALQVYPGGIVNTYRWKPLIVNRTKIEVDWWLPDSEPNAVEREIIHQHRTTTFAEDGPIVDSVQRGLETGAIGAGALVVDDACSSQSEHPIMAFTALYQGAMDIPAP